MEYLLQKYLFNKEISFISVFYIYVFCVFNCEEKLLDRTAI